MSVCELSEEGGGEERGGGREEGEERRTPEVTLRPRCVCVCPGLHKLSHAHS